MSAASASNTTLRGRQLAASRAMWVAVAGLTLGLFVAGIPARFEQLLAVAAQYKPALLDLGLSVRFYGAYFTALDLIIVLTHSIIALAIFWRRSDDWMALFVSLTLVVAPLSVINALGTATVQPAWRAPVAMVTYLGLVASVSLLYLFPDGRFVPRWTGLLAALWAGLNLPAIFLPDTPFSFPTWPLPVRWLLLLGWSSSGVYAQLYRYLRVSGVAQRQQIRWAVLGLMATVLSPIGYYLLFISLPSLSQPSLPGLYYQLAGPTVFTLSLVYRMASVTVFTFGLLLFPLSFAVAILRHRLWNIDLLINRTLVYSALTAIIVGMYVLAVGYLGALFQARGSLLVSILATGLIAVLIQPLRSRLQGGVNRLMYGERDDPVAVLSRLGQRLDAALAPEAVLPTIVETVAQTLKLPYAAILLKYGKEFKIAAEYASPRAGVEDEAWPLIYQSETVGQLIVASRAPGEALTAGDRRLLEEIAHQAGTAAQAVRLTADLKRSRERLITAREEERRRLRRDLHDGLGPTLASQTLKLEAALDLVTGDPETGAKPDPAAARALLLDLKAQSQGTVDDVRRLVYDLRPPALDELGLIAALRAHVGQYGSAQNGLQLSIEAPPQGLPPLSAAVEVAAYRIALEAITNVLRHARPRRCVVRFSVVDERSDAGSPGRAAVSSGRRLGLALLEMEIIDDGIGLPREPRLGVGLTSMRERATELGGTCAIEPGPGGGTRVVARLPLIREG